MSVSINGTVETYPQYGELIFLNAPSYWIRDGRKYLIYRNHENEGVKLGISGYGANQTKSFIFTATAEGYWYGGICLGVALGNTYSIDDFQVLAFDLTKMFGSDQNIVNQLGLNSVTDLTSDSGHKAAVAFKKLFFNKYYANIH